MKKYLQIMIIGVMLFNIKCLYAQNYYTRSNPETDLSSFSTINGQWNASSPINNTLGVIHYQGLNFGFDVNNYASLVSGVESSELYFGRWSGNWKGWRKIIMESQEGNVGIGTTNPLAKLEVNNGDLLVRNLGNINNESAIMIGQSVNAGPLTTFGTSIRTFTQSAENNTYAMQFFTQASYTTNQTEKLRIQGNGNVGIGTTNPTSKLTVAGNIHAQEVKVSVNAGLVPDYVFASDYKLKSLQEVEDYIKENSHLPEIPSAAEIEKNGLMLAEMNLNLLKKMEEMTLYMIEQNKSMENLKKEVEFLKFKL